MGLLSGSSGSLTNLKISKGKSTKIFNKGDSAYDIAVENGFQGTEQEWLESLRGESVVITNVTEDKDFMYLLFSDNTLAKIPKSQPVTATVEEVSGGHLVTMTDAVNGSVSFLIADGEKGDTPVITATKENGVATLYSDGAELITLVDGAKGDKGDTPVISTTKEGATTTVFSDGVQIAQILDGKKGDTGEKGDKGDTPVITATKDNGVATLYSDGVQVVSIMDGPKGDKGDDGREIVFVTGFDGVIYWRYSENDNNWKQLIDLGTLALNKYEEEFQSHKVVEIVNALPEPVSAKEGVLYILGQNEHYTAYAYVNGAYVQVMKPVSSLVGENYNDLIDVPVIVLEGTTQYSYINMFMLDYGRYSMSGYYKWQASDAVLNTGAEKMRFDVVQDTVTNRKQIVYNTYENGEIYENIVIYNNAGTDVDEVIKRRLHASYWEEF